LRRARNSNRVGFDFVRCRICGDHRRVISARHLSKHGTDREEYMQEYGLSPDKLIAKDFRIIQSSRRGYRPYGKRDWVAAIKKIHKNGGTIGAGDLQHKNQNLYRLGVWIFGDWDNALRAAGINPEMARMRSFWDKKKILNELQRMRKQNLPLYAKYVMKNHSKFFHGALAAYGSWNKAVTAAGITAIPRRTRLGLLRELRDAMESRSEISKELRAENRLLLWEPTKRQVGAQNGRKTLERLEQPENHHCPCPEAPFEGETELRNYTT
jgi:hypothetical protein